jgi:hypothetical protein
MSNSFKRLMSRLPYSWEKILGMGISFFLREQDPDNVEFNIRVSEDEPVGWEIRVETDKQNVEEAKDFWINHVQERLE